MHLFSKHFAGEGLEKVFDRFKHVDFCFFQDRIPTVEELTLSKINIFAHQEPNIYEKTQDWVLQNKNLFSLILTWDDKLLFHCPQAVYLPFGHTWLTPDQIEKQREKKFELAHLCGKLLLTYGHQMRHEVLARQDEIKIPKRFFHTIGSRYDIADARLGKEHVFGEPQFAIAIENTSHNGYFTEKILDCFLMKTIPLYWGCSNIGKFFDADGIIPLENPDQLIQVANTLSPDVYQARISAIEHNYHAAKHYIDYLGNIAERIEKVFRFNKLMC